MFKTIFFSMNTGNWLTNTGNWITNTGNWITNKMHHSKKGVFGDEYM